MKILFGTHRWMQMGLAVGIALASSTAMADVICQGSGGLPLFKGFELEEAPDTLAWTKDAAVILNTGTSKILLTGKVKTTPTRVGSYVHYTLTDAAGAVSELSYSVSTFVPGGGPCTRAGCDNQGEISFPGTLLHNGETHAVLCEKVGA